MQVATVCTKLASERCMQLSMTRALGHNMLADFGVIPVPTVAQRELRPENTCLVIASDGELVSLAGTALRS